MTPKELFAIINKRWKWCVMDKDRDTWVCVTEPKLAGDEWTFGEPYQRIDLLFDIDFGPDDFTKCIARRDEIDMNEVRGAYIKGGSIASEESHIQGLTAVVEYVRKQLEHEGKM